MHWKVASCFTFMTPKVSVSSIFEDILMTSDEILERPCLSVTVHVSLILRCKSPLSHPKWIHLLSHKVCHAKIYLASSHYFCSVVCVSLGVIWCSYKFYDHERKRYSTNLCFLRKYRPILVFQLITRSGVSLFLAHFCIPREFFPPPSSSSVLPLLVSAFSFICRIQPSIQPLVPSPLQAASSAAHFSRFQFLPLLQSIQSLPSFPSIPFPFHSHSILRSFHANLVNSHFCSAFRSSEFCLLSRIIPFPHTKPQFSVWSEAFSRSDKDGGLSDETDGGESAEWGDWQSWNGWRQQRREDWGRRGSGG